MSTKHPETIEQMVTRLAKEIETPWGFAGIGEIVYARTYARTKEDGTRESWSDTVARVIAGTRQINARLTSAEEERLAGHLLALRGSVSGRALWQLGTPMIERFGQDSLLNCYALNIGSVDDIIWLMGRLMVGGGVGFSIEREVIHDLPKVKGAKVVHEPRSDADYIVPDSREGWCELMRQVLNAAFDGRDFTYSTQLVRPSGAPLKTFGGTASGATALIAGIEDITAVLNARAGNKLRPTDVIDICNIIGRLVVAGSARRSAQIAIGDVDDLRFLKAKRWADGNIPAWRANSNNTIVVNDFDELPAQFWANFDGSAEPYGLFNRKLARTAGRLGERKSDPSVVVTNPCFSGDTRFLTADGWRTFAEMVGARPTIIQDARVTGTLVDGRETWNVDPAAAGVVTNGASDVRITARARQLYRLTTTDGRTVRATDDHHFATPDGMVELRDLRPGDELFVALPAPYHPDRGSIEYDFGYLMGLTASDGHFHAGRLGIRIWGDPEHLAGERARIGAIVERAIGAAVAERPEIATSRGTRPVSLAPAWVAGTPTEGGVHLSTLHSTAIGRYAELRGWTKDTLDWLHYESADFKAGFLSGFAYGDGSIQDANGSVSARISQSDRDTIATLQLLLQEMGVRASLLFRHEGGDRLLPDGRGGRAVYPTQPMYELIVSGRRQVARYAEVVEIPPHAAARFAALIGRYRKSVYRQSDVTTVASIEIDAIEDVYCLREDERRTLIANGLTARRCGEISLSHREACNLATIFLPNIESAEQLIDVSTLLYKVQKATALLPHPDASTQAIVHKNMRLGQSLTGILQASEEQRGWVDAAYAALVATDETWSREIGVKPSIKLTAVQPSGTLSLLPGVTPGVHGAYAPHYIRRVRFGAHDPLVEVCRAKGYPVAYDIGLDGREDHSRFVVEFPAKAPAGTRIAGEMSAIEQLETVVWAQRHWADNMVSVTVTYRDEELPAIKAWLAEHYDREIKSVSFLRYSEHGFVMAPYEPIDEAEYERRVAALKHDLPTMEIIGVSDLDGDDCIGGACPVR